METVKFTLSVQTNPPVSKKKQPQSLVCYNKNLNDNSVWSWQNLECFQNYRKSKELR